MNLLDVARLRNRRTARRSSYDVSGRNADSWRIPAGQSRVLADLRGPGIITHIWMTQGNHYRECLLKIAWDDAKDPSVLCPLGDFFGLGHGLVNSYQSLLFTASTAANNEFNRGCALNCYAPMPFAHRAVVELINESGEEHNQYFYVDYETCAAADLRGLGYFHAEFRRTNPFGGWAPEITVNTAQANAVNKERIAWQNNYVILETRGRGHYLGCNLSVTNFQGTWWGEGDDMIWVDGYKWPPDLHGTGSEDYLNQAWGMQPNAFLRNGSSIFERNTGGYQTSYVHHLENPVRFNREIKVTIEHGHANHLGNEMSSVAYWYAAKPTRIAVPPPVAQRLPAPKVAGKWTPDPRQQCPGKAVSVTPEMRRKKAEWRETHAAEIAFLESRWRSPFVMSWQLSKLLAPQDITRTRCARLKDRLDWQPATTADPSPWLVSVHDVYGDRDGLVYLGNRFRVQRSGRWIMHLGHDGPARLFVDGKIVATESRRQNPCPYTRTVATVALKKGLHEIMVALDTDRGRGWGIVFSFEVPPAERRAGRKPVFPEVVTSCCEVYGDR
jgi:hypothetical protein